MSKKQPPSEELITYQNQLHEGTGDNVLGDKILNAAIRPKALQSSIKLILSSLRHRKSKLAKEQLSTLKTTSELDEDAINTLNLIELLVNLSEDTQPRDSYSKINGYIKSNNIELYTDIATSALLRLDAKNNNVSDARMRYQSQIEHGEYTNEAYFEFIADPTEITEAYRKNKLHLTEPELCGLIRGHIRNNHPEEALDIAEHLHTIEPTYNSKILVSICRVNNYFKKEKPLSYWQIKATSRKHLLKLSDNVVELLNEWDGFDPRIFDIASTLLDFIFGQYLPLTEACWKHIREIEKLRPRIAENLRLIYEREPNNTDNIPSKIIRAQEDPTFKEKIITEITQSENITAEESTLLSSIGDKDAIKEWINAGGEITSENQFEHDFSILKLHAYACSENREENEDLRRKASEIVNTHRNELTKLNPIWTLELCDKLIDIGLSSIACEILSLIIPTNDIWPSPIVRCYLNALLTSEQVMTLNTTLSEIDENEWDDYIWQINARMLALQHKYEDAIISAEHALQINSKSLYTWYTLITFRNSGDSILIYGEF